MVKALVNESLQELPPLGESSSEVSHFITEPENFGEVTKLLDEIKKNLAKCNSKLE